MTPQYLPAVPLDRYDGKPLKYRIVEGQPMMEERPKGDTTALAAMTVED